MAVFLCFVLMGVFFSIFLLRFVMSSLITHKCSLITLKRVFICYLL